MLVFSNANAKIESLMVVDSIKQFLGKNKKVYSLDLLSGHSCPFASECLSRVIENEHGIRKLVDGPDTQFRCFSASQEIAYPAVYNLRNGNFSNVRGLKTGEIAEIIALDMPHDMGVCRIHVGGDFFNESYMLAWADIARQYSNILFYAYTKSLPYWVKNRKELDSISNLVLTASYGGQKDSMIKEFGLRSSRVIFEEAEANGLVIDHDDSAAADPSRRFTDFVLLLHGQQPAGSKASKAKQKLVKDNVRHSYSKKGK